MEDITITIVDGVYIKHFIHQPVIWGFTLHIFMEHHSYISISYSLLCFCCATSPLLPCARSPYHWCNLPASKIP